MSANQDDQFVYEKLIADLSQTLYATQEHIRHSPDPCLSSNGLPALVSPESSLRGVGPSTNPGQRLITRLEIYDFDSTLFRSPLPNPDIWAPPLRGRVMADCAWFSEPRTLSHPYIPSNPGNEWWHEETVARAVAALAKPDTLTVLLTGRRYDLFSTRIQTMCESKQPVPLLFDIFFFREGHNQQSPRYHATTLDFKLAVLDRLLESFPSITHVEFYDDRERHLKLFQRHVESLIDSTCLSTFKTHHVVHNWTMHQYIPPHLETALVLELIENCNTRIHNAKAREEEADTAGTAGTAALEPIVSTRKEETSLTCDATHLLTTEPKSGLNNEACPSLAGSRSGGLITDNSDSESTNESTSETSSPMDTPPGNTSCPGDLQGPNGGTQLKPLSYGLQSKAPIVQRPRHTPRRVSISSFRNLIDPVDTVRYTCISLDDASHAMLLQLFPSPLGWKSRARDIIINMGQAPGDVIDAMGGIGAHITMTATDVGEVPNCLRAIRVAPSGGLSTMPIVSLTSSMQVVLCVSPTCVLSEPNTIETWTPLSEPFEVSGSLSYVMIKNLKSLLPVIGSDGTLLKRNSMTPKDVSIGALITKYYPLLKGRQIGAACQVVNDWMSKTFMENIENNRADIEFFIQSQIFE
ncbi:hypothetical protein BASA83_005080 [Batrachochytrium salamandrivorans]|nr:hypothetical protein BASA62_009265 [Batrachochytrium salamandrivorans]KAH9272579.1 hypothetical protein BASA83_005080 [Batrachochytrium salamandrivorans]